MNRVLLYYPGMFIQDKQWLSQSILYWDAVGSIIPEEYVDGLMYVKETKPLLDRGLYKIYKPDEYVTKNQKLADEFENLIETYLTQQPKTELARTNISWIFETKMTRELADKLIEKSVLIRNRNRFYMSPRNTITYMSLLAKHMANDDLESITTPSTGHAVYSRLLFPEMRAENSVAVGNLSLQNVLPVPVENVPIVDILKFKERRKDELLQFRQTIYEHQDKLKQVQDPSEIRDLNSRFGEKIQIEISNLGKAFKGDDIQFFFGSLKNLLAIETPALIAAYAMQFPDPVKVNMSIAGAVVSGAISLGEYFLDSRNKENERLAQNSFSYLFYAKEEGII